MEAAQTCTRTQLLETFFRSHVTHHRKVLDRTVLPAEVAALKHLLQLVAGPVEDVLHVGGWIHQISGLVPIAVFGRQTRQVSQMVDVGVGERREAKAVDVADGDGRENHLWRGLLIERRDVRVFQVRDGTLGRLVQEECQRCQEGESPQSLPEAQATRDEDVVNPMEGAGVGKGGQVLGRRCAALLDQTLLVPILLALLLLVLLCKFNFANKFDRHGGSQVCV